MSMAPQEHTRVTVVIYILMHARCRTNYRLVASVAVKDARWHETVVGASTRRKVKVVCVEGNSRSAVLMNKPKVRYSSKCGNLSCPQRVSLVMDIDITNISPIHLCGICIIIIIADRSLPIWVL